MSEGFLMRSYWMVLFSMGFAGILQADVMVKSEALPSWKEGPVKERILSFVTGVTDKNSPSFVPVEERIATFDMDGTLICEKPQAMVETASLAFLKAVAEESPTLRQVEPYKTAYAIGDLNATTPAQEQYLDEAFLQILNTAFMNYSQAQFTKLVGSFLKTTEHPRFKRFYIDLVYQPMTELVDYLQQNGFTVYVVSGSWQAFVRIVGTQKLGFERHRLIGTQVSLSFDVDDGQPRFIREGIGLEPANVKSGKAENIYYHIGQQPIFAFGNSSGDVGMYQYTAATKHPFLVLSLEHDDAKREYLYPSGIDFSANPSWHPVSMQENFKTLF